MAAGYDGTWVAHPDLCKLAKDIFVKGLDGKNNQVHRFVIKTFFRQIFIDFKDVGLSVLRILFTPSPGKLKSSSSTGGALVIYGKCSMFD